MSLTLINTVKVTPLNKVRKKRGMTLIEIMAALAIVSIVFLAISNLILNNFKLEQKSNIKIQNYTLIKGVTDLFETNTGGVINEGSAEGFEYYITDEVFKECYKDKKIYISFDSSDEMKKLLKSGDVNEYTFDEELHESNKLYELRLKIESVKSKDITAEVSTLYNIKITLIDKLYDDIINKDLYVSRMNFNMGKGVLKNEEKKGANIN